MFDSVKYSRGLAEFFGEEYINILFSYLWENDNEFVDEVNKITFNIADNLNKTEQLFNLFQILIKSNN